ncbi:YncE family protein [Flavobacterium sp. HSC-61S13]|uniref:YncE family protein n=1 Tax=Flavobacterium sp. HSC-61S13 TaxID=2910963 RepID=UPI0020A01646|nr:hypothetical protein [Flavobacterium sp. HSC-61S13]MCP1995767.1 hypothetical protein [Flavobacterium sp. HSC-61S13]
MKKIILLALSVTFFISCSKSDDPFVGEIKKNNYSNTVLMLNEGNFGLSNSSIYIVSNTLTNQKHDAYTKDESVLGDVAQSMGFLNDKAFIVVNNSNKVEVVNRYTFESLGTITEKIAQPRYVAFASGKAYVSNAASQSITIYSSDTYEFIKEIKLNGPVERIISENNKIYVQKAAYSVGNEIVIINTSSDEISKTIKVNDALQDIVSNTGFVYAISSIPTRTNYYKINAEVDTVMTTFTSTKVVNGQKLRVDQNKLYYVSNNDIYSWEPLATTVDYKPMFSIKGSGYGFLYAFDVIDGRIFTADALDFKSKSAVAVYNLKGEKITEFEGGIATSSFYKN